MAVFLGSVNKSNIEILQVNYFGDINDPKSGVYNQNFNSKVRYKRLGKTYLAHIEIDFFNRRIYIPKQPKEGKVYKGLLEALNKFQFNK
jgi:hypothetical protein